jgi:hypothetical protein
MKEKFETWYKAKYMSGVNRSFNGRLGWHLREHDGEYVCDHARTSYEAFTAAFAM